MKPVANPPNPWTSAHVEYLDEAPPAALEVYEERARSIVSENDSPDVPFRYSVNPYRGCMHACAYCYARPTHQYIGYGAGTDFDRRIVVKTNAAALLREAFEHKRWSGELVNFSGVTDCYQPLEASYRVTRAMLEVCVEYRNPVGIITKGALVLRDVDLLQQLAREADAFVFLSIAFADEDTARAVEPWAATLRRRYETIERLAKAGLWVGVSLAPMIPGLNEADAPAILRCAKEAGARAAFTQLLRLPREVLPVFDERIAQAFPMRAARITRALEEMRDGDRAEERFGMRMRGTGVRWQAARNLFELERARLGLDQTPTPRAGTFRRTPRQGTLF